MNENSSNITFYEAQQATNVAMQQDKNHDMMLDLSLSGQKSANIFAADQTPTPTRLIKNCDEVGLFDDLRHVNPFDETFRRAVEQNETGKIKQTRNENNDTQPEEESLHTPQVFPQLESNGNALFQSCEKALESPTTAGVALDVTVVDLLSDCATYMNRQNSCGSNFSEEKKQNKYRNIAEKPETNNCLQIAPTSIQLIQPQLITLSFPNNNENVSQSKQSTNAIPVQTVKPFILPKPATVTVAKQPNTTTANSAVSTNHVTINSPSINNEPSSASLTPTSQLPIKERLKAILNQNNRRSIEIPVKTNIRQRPIAGKAHYKFDEDCMERRRAAATRYRVKMRNEHKDLRRKNTELQAENEKLRNRVTQLEQILCKQQTMGVPLLIDGANKSAISTQLEFPSSTIRLVMNIPKLVVTPNGQPLLQNPITYSIEKK